MRSAGITPSRLFDVLAAMPSEVKVAIGVMLDRQDDTVKIGNYLRTRVGGIHDINAFVDAFRIYRAAPETFGKFARQIDVRDELIKLYRSQESRYQVELARESRSGAYSQVASDIEAGMRETLESVAKIDLATGMLKVSAAAVLNSRASSEATADRISAVLSADPGSRRRVAEVARGLLARVMNGREVTDAG